MTFRKEDYMPIKSEADILDGIKRMTWYSPVDFGNGIVARTNHPPSFSIDPDTIHSGEGKWNYILRRNLPNLQGKRILDLGCNNGIMCIRSAREGAIDIVGIDNSKLWRGWIEQSQFVKESIEWRCKTSFPIKYIDSDMGDVPKLGLGHFDVVLILCSLYYLDDNRIDELLKHLQKNSDHLLIQCNTANIHTGDVRRRATVHYMVDALSRAGFGYIYTDEPFIYKNPVVVATNKKFKTKGRLSLDSSLAWLREKL
jgi:SAM-dependent methyltransferase